MVALEYATGTTAAIFGKPERAMFETVLGNMRLPAASVAMVGDDPITDAAAAAAVGMRTVLVRTGNTGKTRRIEASQPTRPRFNRMQWSTPLRP